jgi:hypothetical protein
VGRAAEQALGRLRVPDDALLSAHHRQPLGKLWEGDTASGNFPKQLPPLPETSRSPGTITAHSLVGIVPFRSA